MGTEAKIRMLKGLQHCPLRLKVALYNISIASELEEQGQPVDNMETMKEILQDALNAAYHTLKAIDLNTYCFIYSCYLNENKS